MQGRFGKVVLVVLGVILMIVFILPPAMQNMAGGESTLGTIAGKDVGRNEVLAADSLFQYASQRLVVPVGQGQDYPLPAIIFGDFAETLEDDPELFYLLLRESEETGATIPPEPLEERIANLGLKVLVKDPAAPGGERLMEFKDIPGEQIREDVLRSVRALLSVERSFQRYADYPHISRPVLDYFLATQSQEVDLRTVVFDAESFLEQAEMPSEQAVAAHFEEHKDTLAGAASEENPFGFGYRLPDGVKFEYLTVAGDAARRHVLAGMADSSVSERERALYRYWTENRARFPVPPGSAATQPSTQPSTQPAPDAATTQPTTQPAAEDAFLLAEDPQVRQFLDQQTLQVAGTANEADWRTYLAVHDDVVELNVAGEASALKSKLMRRIAEILTSDYRSFDLARASAADGQDAPAGPAKTRVGVPVDDAAYLEKVAEQVAQELGVRPSVSMYNGEFFGAEALEDEAVVGPIASAISPQFQAMFPVYVMGATLPLLEGTVREQIEQSGNGLALYKPSEPLMDILGNSYVFRVTAARPAAAPDSLAQVQEQVRLDLRKRAAYELALAEARRFVEEARQSSLDSAAGDRPVHDPEPFFPAAGMLDEEAFGASAEEPLSPASRSQLAESIYSLLSDPELAEAERPVGVLEIQPAFRAVAAELQELIAGWGDDQMLSRQREQLRAQLHQASQRTGGVASEFFDFDRVARRVGYERSEPRPEREEAGEAP